MKKDSMFYVLCGSIYLKKNSKAIPHTIPNDLKIQQKLKICLFPQACYVRGMNGHSLSASQCREWLSQWLQFSIHLNGWSYIISCQYRHNKVMLIIPDIKLQFEVTTGSQQEVNPRWLTESVKLPFLQHTLNVLSQRKLCVIYE